MILPSRDTWILTATAAVVITTIATLWISSSGACEDERPPLDERIDNRARALGEAREQLLERGNGELRPELRERYRQFAAASEAQLVAIAAQIERRAALPRTPQARIEQLRRDYVHLAEQRQRVLDSVDSESRFEENRMLFDTAVGTIREQLTRLDEGMLP